MKRILLALLASLLFIPPLAFSCAPNASADDNPYDGWMIEGCATGNGATPKLEQWWPGAYTYVWADPTHTLGRMQFQEYANLYYWWCPQGDKVNKIKVYAWQLCAIRHTKNLLGNEFAIRGWKHNPYIATESGAVLNPGADYMEWNGLDREIGDSKCSGKRGIPAEDRFWMIMSNNPYWELGGSIDQKNMGDVGWNLLESGNKKFIHPGEDSSLLSP